MIDRILVIAALVIAAFFAMKWVNTTDKLKRKDTVIAEKNASIRKITTRSGKVAFDKRRAIASLRDLKDSYSYLEDSLKKLNVKLKNLQTVTFASTHATTFGSTQATDTVFIKDSVKVEARNISISKPFFKLDGTLFPNNDFNYTAHIYDSLALINTVTKNNIFSKWEYNTRIVSANPDLEVTGITSLTVKEKGNRFSVGIVVGYGIGNSGLTPFIGIGVSRALITF